MKTAWFLLLSAWFHDTGYSSGKVEGHEEISVQIATQFLQQHAVSDMVQQRVTSCIRATHMPQSPISQVEKILCDADLLHLSTGDFKALNQLLKQERENLLGHKISKKNGEREILNSCRSINILRNMGNNILSPKSRKTFMALTKKKMTKKLIEEKETKAFPYVSDIT